MSEKGRRDSAKVFADPLGCAVVSIGQIFEKGKNADGSKGLNQAELVDRLADAVIRLQDGKMDGIEEMLLLQAHTLQALATKHIMRMAQNAPSLEEEQFHVGVAMKAMNQCRQTLHTLGELKNPRRSTFVKQQNNALFFKLF